jgi:serine/threonine-protein kinase
MVGTTVSHYEIRAKLGGGGMGVVYRAEDTKLHRTVALKFLPPEMTRDEDAKQRFIQEAQAASALDHPNICTIHDIDETDDGRLFICMACYDGETAKQKIRHGPLPLADAVDIAIGTAQGLVRAHREGIVHRDIKPANVFVTREGRAKILDFGVAKLVGQTMLTEVGTVVGTAAYMSPEQAKGKTVDHRTDLWSLGATLYHMVAGRLPFEADHPQAALYAICHEDPEPVATLREGVPPELVAVIERCLQKDPAKRYGSAEEIVAALAGLASAMGLPVGRLPTAPTMQMARPKWLRPGNLLPISAAILACALLLTPPGRDMVTGVIEWVAPPPVIPEVRHVALLPLTPASEAEPDVFLAEGLSEHLAFRLSQMERADSLFWILPSSEVREIDDPGPERVRDYSGVTHALQGRIEKRGPVLRVTMNTVDTGTLHVLDTERFSARSGDAHTLPSKIVLHLIHVLGLDPEPSLEAELVAGTTRSPEACEAYLTGLGAYQQAVAYGEETIGDAIALLRDAIDYDAGYALAHAALGEALWHKWKTVRDSLCRAEAIGGLERAIELESRIAPAHVALADIHAGAASPDYGRAMDGYERALEADPVNAAALTGLAEAYHAKELYEEAERTYRDAIDRRPGYWHAHRDLAYFYLRRGRYAEAEAECQAAIDLAPGNWSVYNNMAVVLDAQGRGDEACRYLERANAIEPTSKGYSNLATRYFKNGDYEDAANCYEVAVGLVDGQLEDGEYQVWGNLACSLSELGEDERAREAYRRAAAWADSLLLRQPNDPKLLCLLAAYRAALGDSARAFELTQTALDFAPGNLTVMFQAGHTYEVLGDRERALEWIARALEGGYSLEEVETAPGLAELRKDERYRRLIESTGAAS